MNRRDFLKWLGAAPVAYSFIGSGLWTPPVQRIELDVKFGLKMMDAALMDKWHSVEFHITDFKKLTFERWVRMQDELTQRAITGPNQTVEDFLRRGFDKAYRRMN